MRMTSMSKSLYPWQFDSYLSPIRCRCCCALPSSTAWEKDEREEKVFFIVNVKCNGLIMKMPKNIVELSAILRQRKSGKRKESTKEDMRVKRFKWRVCVWVKAWKLKLFEIWVMMKNLKASFATHSSLPPKNWMTSHKIWINANKTLKFISVGLPIHTFVLASLR